MPNFKGEDLARKTKVKLWLEPEPDFVDPEKMNLSNSKSAAAANNKPIQNKYHTIERILRLCGTIEKVANTIFFMVEKVLNAPHFRQGANKNSNILNQQAQGIDLQLILPDNICTSIFGSLGEKVQNFEKN